MYFSIAFGCVMGQVFLALVGIQTPHESFVAGTWQISGIVFCGLTPRAPDWLTGTLKKWFGAIANR